MKTSILLAIILTHLDKLYTYLSILIKKTKKKKKLCYTGKFCYVRFCEYIFKNQPKIILILKWTLSQIHSDLEGNSKLIKFKH